MRAIKSLMTALGLCALLNPASAATVDLGVPTTSMLEVSGSIGSTGRFRDFFQEQVFATPVFDTTLGDLETVRINGTLTLDVETTIQGFVGDESLTGGGTMRGFLAIGDTTLTQGSVTEFASCAIPALASSCTNTQEITRIFQVDRTFTAAEWAALGAAQFRIIGSGSSSRDNGATLSFTSTHSADLLITFTYDDLAPIPLPASLPLLLAGMAGFALLRRRRSSTSG